LLKLSGNDQWSGYDFFLIPLANRFNSAYYLLLNTGKWSGGETRNRLKRLSGVVETRQIAGLLKFMLRTQAVAGTEESFPFWEYFFRTS
jgi:hypothetical protein